MGYAYKSKLWYNHGQGHGGRWVFQPFCDFVEEIQEAMIE